MERLIGEKGRRLPCELVALLEIFYCILVALLVAYLFNRNKVGGF